MLIFIYSIADKTTFSMISDEIEKMVKEIPKDKFVGILIGNKIDLSQERVFLCV